ncbi:phage tail tape measure protein [Pseudomonas tohonis]|nr:hypothetical protein L682_10975 [Pseudomonas alcaligenes OT 69]MDN4148696.1 phage tail tape measure protein [Pseudomonas tohonis]
MSDVQLKIGIDDADSVRRLNQFRKAAEATIDALQKPVGKVTAFAQLQDSVESTGKSLATAKGRLRDLQQELVRIDSANAKSASTWRDLTASVRTMESNARRLDALTFGRANLVQARDRVRDLGNQLAAAADPSAQLQNQYAQALEAYQKLQRSVKRDEVKLSVVQVDSQALQQARQQLAGVAAEMQRGQAASRQLQTDYKRSTSEVNQLTASATRQTAQLSQMGNQLRAAGVDTSRLGAEQQRLRGELAKQIPNVALQAAVAGARDSLGVRPFAEINGEITKLQRNFALLKSSGSLTGAELVQAQVRMLERTRELTEQTNGWRSSLANVKSEIIAGAAAFGGIALVGRNAFQQFAGFEQEMAGVRSITDLTGTEVTALSAAVRQLSLDMGKPAAQSASALRDILGSGIETGKGLDVLEKSSRAAIAGITDTKTAASVGVSVLNAYGDGVDKLDERYDQLFLTIQDGVVEFDELAAGLGQVLPNAAAAGVGFDEIGAAIARMTVQGIKAPIAITGLRSAITQLSSPSPQAAKAMKELGIQWNGLSGTLRQIASQKLGTEAMRSIVPDIEGRTAVLALTNQIDAFNDQLKRMDDAAGSTQRAYDIMKDTPQQQVEQFKAAVNELQIAFGQVVAAGLPLVNVLTDMLNAFSELPGPVKTGLISLVALAATGKALAVVLSAVRGPFSLLLTHLAQVPAGAGAAGAAADKLGGRLGRLGAIAGRINLGSALAGGGYGIILSQLMELEQLHQELKEIQQEQENYAQSLDAAVQAGEPYRNSLILTQQEVGQLTVAERNAYAERLKNAETYYRKLAERTERENSKANGIAAPVAQASIDASRQARAYSDAYQAINAVQEQRLEQEKAWQARQDKIKASELVKTKEQLAKLTDEYEEANKRLEKVRAKRLDIQKQYAALANSFTAPKGEATFGSLNQAKISARDALRVGDTDKALREADRAAKIMEQLRDAGENTYGFKGIAQELGKIADAAAKIDEDGAEASVKAREVVIEQLLQKAEALKRITVGFVGDTESEEATRQRMIALAQEWQKYMQVKVTLIPPDTGGIKDAGKMLDAAGRVDGYASGTASAVPGWHWVGENGPELRRFRGGEQVLPSGLSLALDSQMQNANAMRNLPVVPQVGAAALQPANPLADFGRAELGLPDGGSVEVLMRGDSFEQLLRRVRRQRGN